MKQFRMKLSHGLFLPLLLEEAQPHILFTSTSPAQLLLV